MALWRRVERIHKSGLSMVWDWQWCRDVTPETAQGWLDVWSKDEPQAVFMVNDGKPRATTKGSK